MMSSVKQRPTGRKLAALLKASSKRKIDQTVKVEDSSVLPLRIGIIPSVAENRDRGKTILLEHLNDYVCPVTRDPEVAEQFINAGKGIGLDLRSVDNDPMVVDEFTGKELEIDFFAPLPEPN